MSGIAHAEIDNVVAARARLSLEAVYLLEDVRRQPLDLVKFFLHGRIAFARFLIALFAGR